MRDLSRHAVASSGVSSAIASPSASTGGRSGSPVGPELAPATSYARQRALDVRIGALHRYRARNQGDAPALATAQTQRRVSAPPRPPRDDRIPGEQSSRRAASRRCLWRHVNLDDPAASTPGLACGSGPRGIAGTDSRSGLAGAGRLTQTAVSMRLRPDAPRVAYFAWGRPWETSPNSAICCARASPPEALTTPRFSTTDPARTITR